MKRIILVLVLILVAVYAILSVLGSNSENAAEKLFYRATKTYRKIAINPEIAPPAMLAAVENDLQQIVEKFPEAKVAKIAQFALAEFYLTNKKYNQALAALDAVISKYKQDIAMTSRAQFFKGLAYERQNLWGQALVEYEILRDKYTDTPLGLQVPLYIGNYYTEKEKYALAEEAYSQATVFYQRLERENKAKVFGYMAANFLLQTQIKRQDYEQAAEVVQNTINNYPSALTFTQQLPNVELIFIQQLKNPERALEIYRTMKEKTTDPALIESLTKKIEALEK